MAWSETGPFSYGYGAWRLRRGQWAFVRDLDEKESFWVRVHSTCGGGVMGCRGTPPWWVRLWYGFPERRLCRGCGEKL